MAREVCLEVRNHKVLSQGNLADKRRKPGVPLKTMTASMGSNSSIPSSGRSTPEPLMRTDSGSPRDKRHVHRRSADKVTLFL